MEHREESLSLIRALDSRTLQESSEPAPGSLRCFLARKRHSKAFII